MGFRYNPLTSTLDLVGSASSGANTTLSNLVNTIAIPDGVNLLSVSDGGIDIGSSTIRISQLHTYDSVHYDGSAIFRTGANLNGELINYTDTLPDGSSAVMGLAKATQTSGDMGIFTRNNSSATAAIKIQTGNSSSNDSGLIQLKTGTASGNRGKLDIDALQIDVNSTPIVDLNSITSATGSTLTISTLDSNSNIILNPHGTGTVDVSSSRITSVTDPTSAQDAATKNYVDTNAGANKTLSNLTSPTSFNQNLLPATNNTYTIGTTSNRLSSLSSSTIFGSTANFYESGFVTVHGNISGQTPTMPSGVSVNFGVKANASYTLGLFTDNTSSNSGTLRIETGNSTGVTTNSGDINLQTGTSSSGTRGEINLSASSVDFQSTAAKNINSITSATATALTLATLDSNTNIVLNPHGTGYIDASTSLISNVVDPVGNQDAATKKYVDDKVATISSPNDIDETSFSGANNQVAAANVTGFAFNNANVRGFKALVTITVDATSDLFEAVEITGIQRGADWVISQTQAGDDSLVDFTITTAGQIQYTSGNYAGFTSLTIKFRAITLAV